MTPEDQLKKLQEENDQLQKKIASLENSAERYRRLFEASPDIIFEVDKDYNVIICHIPGIPQENVLRQYGAYIFDITPACFHDPMRKAFEKVLSLGQKTNYESEGETLGAYRYYSNYLSPIFDNEGNVRSIYFISRDVTAQKKAEQIIVDSEKKLKALFDSSKHMHILLGKDAQCLWFNKKAGTGTEILFGKKLLIDKFDYEYIPEAFLPSYRAFFKKCLEGETVTYEREYLIQNGNTQHLELTLQPVYSAEETLIGVSMIAIDITERRSYEENLKKINKELVQQNMQLNQYSYIISHNLRGPIVTLLGLTDVFEQFNTDKILQNEIIGHIKKSTIHLDNIIKDLTLILNNSENTELSKVNIHFEEEITVVKDLLKSQIENAQATIHTDFKEVEGIFSVKSYIQSILLNLMSNSLKYKCLDLPASIMIRTTLSDPNTICISFKDNGLGFDTEKNKDKIFGFYKRFHSHVEGKGLGLYLLKNQVEILKGRVEVESQINKGTTFKIFIPL